MISCANHSVLFIEWAKHEPSIVSLTWIEQKAEGARRTFGAVANWVGSISFEYSLKG